MLGFIVRCAFVCPVSSQNLQNLKAYHPNRYQSYSQLKGKVYDMALILPYICILYMFIYRIICNFIQSTRKYVFICQNKKLWNALLNYCNRKLPTSPDILSSFLVILYVVAKLLINTKFQPSVEQ